MKGNCPDCGQDPCECRIRLTPYSIAVKALHEICEGHEPGTLAHDTAHKALGDAERRTVENAAAQVEAQRELAQADPPALYAEWVRADYADATDGAVARLWRSAGRRDRAFWANLAGELATRRAALKIAGDQLEYIARNGGHDASALAARAQQAREEIWAETES